MNKGEKGVCKQCRELSKGANLNFVSRDGQTALILATGSENFQICRILAENGADPTIKDRMGMSSIDYATLFKKEEILNLKSAIKRDIEAIDFVKKMAQKFSMAKKNLEKIKQGQSIRV